MVAPVKMEPLVIPVDAPTMSVPADCYLDRRDPQWAQWEIARLIVYERGLVWIDTELIDVITACHPASLALSAST